MVFCLKISSKTKLLLFKFINFFSRLTFLFDEIKMLNSYNSKKFITVLKSPHVNKTAQEQFEFRYYHYHFLIYSSKPLVLLVILKRLIRLTFLGLRLELKVLLNSKAFYNKNINPEQVILNPKKKN